MRRRHETSHIEVRLVTTYGTHDRLEEIALSREFDLSSPAELKSIAPDWVEAPCIAMGQWDCRHRSRSRISSVRSTQKPGAPRAA
jgi:hypothetical protein